MNRGAGTPWARISSRIIGHKVWHRAAPGTLSASGTRMFSRWRVLASFKGSRNFRTMNPSRNEEKISKNRPVLFNSKEIFILEWMKKRKRSKRPRLSRIASRLKKGKRSSITIGGWAKMQRKSWRTCSSNCSSLQSKKLFNLLPKIRKKTPRRNRPTEMFQCCV